jgi:hypothetical protein
MPSAAAAVADAVLNLHAHVATAAFLARMVAPRRIGDYMDVAVRKSLDVLDDGTTVSVYRRRGGPWGHDTSPPRGLFLLPGLSVSGARDARIAQLASALAMTGLNVVVPHVRAFEQLLVQPDVVERVADVLASASGRADWCTGEQMHLCAPCISAGVLVLAAVRLTSTARGRVGAILLIGPYANVATVYDWAFFHRAADPYGRNVMLLNAVRMLPEPVLAQVMAAESAAPAAACSVDVDELCLLLKAALDDAHLGPPAARLRDARSSAGSLSCAAFDALTGSAACLAAIGRQLRVSAGAQAYFRELSPVGNIDNLRTPCVALVHGKSDSVVPSTETISLAQHIASACPHVDCLAYAVTPLMGHGEMVDDPSAQVSTLAYVWALVDLLRALAQFFAACIKNV